MFNINEKTCKPQIGMNEKLKNYDKKKRKKPHHTRSAYDEASIYIYIYTYVVYFMIIIMVFKTEPRAKLFLPSIPYSTRF